MDKETTQIEYLKALASVCLESLDGEIRRGLKYKVVNPSDLITLTIRIGAPSDPDGMEFITTRPAQLSTEPPESPPQPTPVTQ